MCHVVASTQQLGRISAKRENQPPLAAYAAVALLLQ
jgi:hypothetical protein